MLRSILLMLSFVLVGISVHAQSDPALWVWEGGDSTSRNPKLVGIYGTQGQSAASNFPGARYHSVSWQDASGNYWLMGGQGYDAKGNFGYLNDLWKYTVVSRQWVWVAGSSAINALGIYGTQGTPSGLTVPGAREGASGWTDAQGNLWLLGGFGYATDATTGYLNDLWRYNPGSNQWTWIKGAATVNSSGSYGSRGVASASNTPGGRSFSKAWTDATGAMFLYAGFGRSGRSNGYFNDLWRYNPVTNQWIWLSGSSLLNQTGIYGTRGVASSTNQPGARETPAGWVDAQGDFWMLGGFGNDSTRTGRLNDFWKFSFSSNQWTWMGGSKTVNQGGTYGLKGVASASNIPSARYRSLQFQDATGRFWLLGGLNSSDGLLNDLWNYNPATAEWTWVSGDATANSSGIYGTQLLTEPGSKSGGRFGAVGWLSSNGVLSVFGGGTIDLNNAGALLNDFWDYHLQRNEWTWMRGENFIHFYGFYGTPKTYAAQHQPGARRYGVSWTDPSGLFWLMGGFGLANSGNEGLLNDLWNYNPATGQWTWISGSNSINPPAVYGTRGTATALTVPGGRQQFMRFQDTGRTVWIFGGLSGSNRLNDLWKYDPVTDRWTWVSGSKNPNQSGVYGVRGVPSASNIPGARQAAVTWTDTSGSFWLFGGYGLDRSGQLGYLNDLWKYLPSLNQWVWIGGSPVINQSGSYNTLGGLPGARLYADGVTGQDGNLWLLGGSGYDEAAVLGTLNDLWKYDLQTNQWFWLKGSSRVNSRGTYGTMGIAETTNVPGARTSPAIWADRIGHIWMLGGNGSDANGTSNALNDLWRYNIASNQWTWMGGSTIANPPPVYGTRGTVSAQNQPAARYGAATWLDADGQLRLMGGACNFNGGNLAISQNDLWIYKLPCAVVADFKLPVTAQCVSGNTFEPVNTTRSTAAQPEFRWTFGNGEASQLKNPVFRYTEPGSYTVKLVALAAGCKDSVEATVEVRPLPDALIQYNGSTELCEGSTLILNGSPAAELDYLWKKDGVTLAAATTNQLSVQEPGVYTLEVTNRITQCRSVSQEVTVTVKSRPVAPNGNGEQTFCNTATVAQLTADGSGLQWYSSVGSNQPILSSDPLTDGVSYFATQKEGGCESRERLEVQVAIRRPVTPDGPLIQKFCYSGSVSGLTASGTDVQWYIVATGGEPLPTDELLTNGSVYYASQTIEGCESANRLPVTVGLLNPLAPSGNSSQTFCGATQLKALVVNGNGILWYNQQTEGVLLTEETVLNSGQTYYAAEVQEGCESRERLSVNVEIKSIPNAPTGSPSQQVCSGATLQSLALTGSGLNWYSVMENGSILPLTTLVTNGATYYASQTVNGCESKDRFPVTASFIASISRPVITVKGLDLVSSTTSGNQWYLNGAPIPGAVASTYRPVETGTYTVQITPNACGALVSDPVLFSVTGGEFVRIGPNPAAQTLRVFWMLEKDVNLHIRIISEQGQLLRTYGLLASGAALDVAALQPGRYYVQLVSGDGKRSYVLGFVRGK